MTLPFSLRRRRCLALAALACAGGAQASEGRVLRIVTAHLPPLVVEGTAAPPGALRELVQELSARMGMVAQVEFVPWPRALFVASKQTRTAIFPLTRLPAREAGYRWLAPLYDENYVFLTPRGSRFDVSRLDEMKSMRIAVIRGAAQATALRQRGYLRIVEARSVDEVHRYLLEGMADAAFGERAIVRNALASRNAVDQFLVSPPAYSNTAWLAGSLDFTRQDAAAFQRAMQQMRADGSYQKILASYGLD